MNHTTYRHLQRSITDEQTWKDIRDHVAGLPQPGSLSLGLVGAAAVLTVGDLRDESADAWRRAWEVKLDPQVGYGDSWDNLDSAIDALLGRRVAGKVTLSVS